MQEAHLAVFTYPLPDGVRPSDLARRMEMTPQATNYLIAQVETLGWNAVRPRAVTDVWCT
ncbi:MarR family transcriptional regulator [Tabrizicola soli]|uniref:MarR family transcriptional regulator n=1 Tax=Tabrizicola soli TaxID=2185115 RepID=A0ABV7DWD0_9RHOB|nr:MarR family transcriptional regulator [Tabrizicola soli]